ncbi:hypothetical protein K0B96_04335 [Horticoccus luteus]|uniref:Cytochrome c domain-containing protein n=1 Tax=Horticoccus luteus TaxID=2862869 RepID=A0A8F9XMA9_9BACT|nr:MbnP family protein [Horticoccus luteus]QYM79854.1 hypothetical protein K0B96_04335 [Horticoccus luteus]
MRWFALLVLPVGSSQAAELTMRVALRWGGESLAVPSTEVRTDAGMKLRVTRLAALLSGAVLTKSDGTVVRLDGQFGFIDAESGRLAWTLRGVPAGDYAGLGFQVGVPTAVNHADPGQWPAGHALNPLVDRLHWSWQGGYVFFALEGRWRDGATPDTATERGFSYHVATEARLMRVNFVAAFRVEGATTVTLALNVARVLAVPQWAAAGNESTHSAVGDELAPKLANAFSRGWFWLGAEEASRAANSARVDEAAEAPTAVAGDAKRGKAAGAKPRAFVVPAGFPQPDLPQDNPLTEEGIALGKVLFNDRRLSAGGQQSCASCHAPERGFSDDVARSRGANGGVGERNAMPLLNLAWSPAFAWDGAQPRIRDQARAAMLNPREMAADEHVVLATLNGDAVLRARFAVAFGPGEITADRLGRALEQYLLTLVAADSKFDRAMRGEETLTAEEQRGFELFATEYDPARGRRGGDCFHCHGGALFTDYAYRSNGLERVSGDAGRARVTGREEDRGKFKTPSLRNVALTAPYMHDGRLRTLEDVVAHYDHGVQRGASLDPNLAKHPLAGMQLPSADQAALVAFLRTLTESASVGAGGERRARAAAR